MSFAEITSGVSKRVAACCFLEVLQLKTRGMLEATQDESFGDIVALEVWWEKVVWESTSFY